MLATVLPSLHSHLQDVALDELTLLRDPSAIQGLEEFLHRGQEIKTGTLFKAIQVLSVLPTENAVEALGQVLSDTSHALAVRRAALVSLSRSPFPRAQQRLVKTGGRLVKHARYYWLLLAESHLTRRLFASMLGRIIGLSLPSG